VIALLDGDGRILAASEAWLGMLAGRGLPAAAGDPGASYAQVIGRLHPGPAADWLQGQIAALAAGRADEVRATFPGAEGAPPQAGRLRIQRLDYERRVLLVATHNDDGDATEARDALQSLRSQLAGARADERRRFAEVLAEMTAAHLDALSRDLRRLRDFFDSEAARPTLERMEGSLRDAMRETRHFGYLLHPVALDEGLASAARQLAREFAADAGLRLRYRSSGPVDAAPRAVQEAAFRVIQEALSNVHRHAEASSVTVSVSARPDASSLRVRIADDGKGLGPGEPALGVGIPGMRSRAAQLGGAVEVTGRRRGVVVVAHLPYGAAATAS
jgi:signal transduction histidine kinase